MAPNVTYYVMFFVKIFFSFPSTMLKIQLQFLVTSAVYQNEEENKTQLMLKNNAEFSCSFPWV
jgi:hypothetical protein